MFYEFVHHRRVEFTDVDMGGVMHFANYFRFMEVAEHAFLRTLGVQVFDRDGGETIAWPRVRATCSYHAPLHHGDEVDVYVIVARKRRRSIELWMSIQREDERVALGGFRNACAVIDRLTGTMHAITIPAWIDKRIVVAPPERLADLPCPWR